MNLQFYSSGSGDKLVEPALLPAPILAFINGEQILLENYAQEASLLCEVGCMDGRYLEWALDHGKKYLGIDPVERYITRGRSRLLEKKLDPSSFALVSGSAEFLSDLIPTDNQETKFAIFPFNSFGNMEHHKIILSELEKIRLPCLITSYATGKVANEARTDYYRNCGLNNVTFERTDFGILFSEGDEFRSLAFYPEVFVSMAQTVGLMVSVEHFADIGVAYIVAGSL